MFSQDHGAAVMRRIFCHERGRQGTRATWWSTWCAVAVEGDRATVETIADRLCVGLDVAQRAVASLAGLGLLDVDGAGLVSRADVADVAQDVSGSSSLSSSTELLPVGLSSFADVGRAELSTSSVELTWQVPAVVMASGFLPAALDLCAYMAEQVAERGDSRAPNRAASKAWVLPMEAILRVDGRRPEQVQLVLDWLHKGADEPSAFWRNNVLAPSSLRSRWERMGHQYRATKAQRPSKQAQVLRGENGPRLADAIGGRG